MLMTVLDATIVNVALVVAGTVLWLAEEGDEEALQARDRSLGDAALPAARVR